MFHLFQTSPPYQIITTDPTTTNNCKPKTFLLIWTDATIHSYSSTLSIIITIIISDTPKAPEQLPEA